MRTSPSKNAQVPKLSLTHGQVVWALCRGDFPPEPKLRQLLDQLRYLRQLGVPFDEAKRGKGRGNPIRYGFDELVELGVAVFALNHRLRPREVAEYLVKHRQDLRRIYREALEEQPAGALDDAPVKGGQRSIVIRANERFLRLHDRYSETPGAFETIGPEKAKEVDEIFGMRETFADGRSEHLLPLTQIVLDLVSYARSAPEIRPGRR